MKQLVTVVIGVIVGLLAVALTLATEAVTTWKNHRTRAIIHAEALDVNTSGFALGMLFHMAFSATLALLGAGVVRAWTHSSNYTVIRIMLRGLCKKGVTAAQKVSWYWIHAHVNMCLSI